jgi:hypothetical protein
MDWGVRLFGVVHDDVDPAVLLLALGAGVVRDPAAVAEVLRMAAMTTRKFELTAIAIKN